MPEEYGTGTEGELDGLLSLAYLAAVTERIRLGIGVCIVPQHNPVYTAKDVTTLDHLSDGRFDFGVGIGWLAEEFEAVGASFSDRADRCREYLEVMNGLWSDPLTKYDGEFYSLPESRQDPRPLQQPSPPIHFGGNSGNALRRVADFGQGWIPWELSPEEMGRKLKQLEGLLEARGRHLRDVLISVAMEMKDDALDIAAYADAGVDQLVIVAPAVDSVDALDPMLDGFAATVVERAHGL
jgi:probable F420-dependent oxidoreductase